MNRPSAAINALGFANGRWRTAALILLCAVAGTLSGALTVNVDPVTGPFLALGMVSAMVSLARHHASIYLVVGVAYLLPFAVAPLPLGGLHPTFLDLALTGALLLWTLRILVWRQDHLELSPLGAPLLVFAGVAAASLLLNFDTVSGQSMRLFVKAVNSLLFYFTLLNTIKTEGQVKQIALVVMGASSLQAAIAVSLYFLPRDVAAQALNSLSVLGYPSGSDVLRNVAGTETLRANGTGIDPNILGGMLLLAAPLIASLLSSDKAPLPRPLLGIMGGIVLLALLLSYSRGAWLGAAVGVLFVATFRHSRLWLLPALLGAAILMSPLGTPFVERLLSGVALEDRASQMRISEYKDAIRLISQYPWLGVGFGAAPRPDLYVAASSMYLLIASQMGLLGLFAFLSTVAVFVVYNLRGLRRAEGLLLDSVHLGAMGGAMGALTAGIFDHYFFNLQFPHMMTLLWLFMGLTMVTSRLLRDGDTAGAGTTKGLDGT